MNEAQARRALVRYSRDMHAAGWVANHDGNLSVRVGEDRIVCTPTSFSKADVELEDLVVVDRSGKKIAGRRRAFSELLLHRLIYDRRPKVAAVVHAHCPYATAYGVAGVALPHPFLPEAVVSLGAEIPTLPLSAPGQASADLLDGVVRRCDAALIAGNGAWAWGPTLELAYLRLELVEHLCRIAHTAAPLGGPRRLPEAMVSALVAKRSKAGIAAPEEVDSAPADLVERATRMALAGIPGADPARVAALVAELSAK